MNEIEEAAGMARTPGYRYADRVGDQLFIAGQVPLDGDGRLIGPHDVAAQTERCMTNLDTLLRAHAFALPDVRHLTLHVVGEVEQLGSAWNVVRERFGGEVPPATLLGARSLGHPSQLVEIDATVVRAPGTP